MRLLITTPLTVVADHTDIVAVRAEDESGRFGILPGHADFLTALAISVLSWRHADGRSGCCAVRGGVMTVQAGHDVSVATREALPGDDVEQLEARVREQLGAAADVERAAQLHAAQLRIQTIRQIIGFLRPRSGAGAGEAL